MSAYDTAVLADNPVGYWPLGELSGTTAADLSTNNLPGTYTGSVVLGQTPLASQINDSVNLPTTAGMLTQTNALYGLNPNNISLELWIKPTALGGFQEAMSSGSGGGYRMLCTNDTLWFLIGGSIACITGSVLTNGNPYHVVMVQDSVAAAVYVYLNGALIFTAASSLTNPGGSQNIAVGSLDGAGSQQFLGNVSNAAVYNYALTAAQVLAHYTAGTVAPTTTTVPDVLGETQTQAGIDIVAASLIVGTVTPVASVSPPGTVLNQNPLGGNVVLVGSAVDLTVSGGEIVPDVVNTSATLVAPGILAAAGFTVGTITYAVSGVIIAGNIISQTPAAGSFAASGSAVNVVVSSGLPPLTVPDLFGLDQTDAVNLLLSLGLVPGAIGSAPSKFVPPDEVQAQNPSAGTAVAVGTVVSFVLSLGTPVAGTLFDFEATVISQYANSPTILQLVNNLNQYVDQSQNFANFFNFVWNVDTAVGFGLDIWGKIVGVSRLLHIPNTTDYVGFDNGTRSPPDWQSMGSDQPPYNMPPVGGAMYTGNNATQTYLLGDDAYRQLILAKAFANITTTTAPAINQILQNLYGPGSAWVLNTGPMAISYNLSFTPTAIQLAILEQSGVIPTPPGVSVVINTNV